MSAYRSYQTALEECASLGFSFRPASGCDGWWAVDTSSPMWHALTDLELASIGLRRSELAPVKTQ